MQKNRIELAGYLATKPEARFLPSGTKVANARLKESYRFTTSDGKQQTHANWHSLVFYGEVADVALSYDKDDNIFVEGSLQQRKFTPADGVTRTVYEITPGAVIRYAQLPSIGTNHPAQTRKVPMQETIAMILRGRLGRLSGIVPAFLAIAGISVAFQLGDIRINASSSLPIGLYRTTPDKSARLIEFCPMEPFASMSASRGYRGKGNCQDRAEPLMKPTVAVAGDIVEVSSRGVAVNGELLPNSAALPLDTKNRPLQRWPFGRYRVAPSTLWVISSFNARSFDSRYFGPVPIASIRCHLRPLLTE